MASTPVAMASPPKQVFSLRLSCDLFAFICLNSLITHPSSVPAVACWVGCLESVLDIRSLEKVFKTLSLQPTGAVTLNPVAPTSSS